MHTHSYSHMSQQVGY